MSVLSSHAFAAPADQADLDDLLFSDDEELLLAEDEEVSLETK